MTTENMTTEQTLSAAAECRSFVIGIELIDIENRRGLIKPLTNVTHICKTKIKYYIEN